MLESFLTLKESLGPELTKQYCSLLRKWCMFSSHFSLEDFYGKAQELCSTPEQHRLLHQHIIDLKLNGVSLKSDAGSKLPENHKKPRLSYSAFEVIDYFDFVAPILPQTDLVNVEEREASRELFMPDTSFITCRINYTLYENEMNGADPQVSELMMEAGQAFVKNIITAMISKKKSYKLRDKKFQYGFNQPIPDPFIRNYRNVVDVGQDSSVTVNGEDDSFGPKVLPSLEHAEQQMAFSYSCAKRGRKDNKLTLRLLYETLKANPRLLGLHGIQSVALIKLGLKLGD